MSTTTLSQPHPLLDRLLEPVRESLTPEAARALLDIRADAQTQAHIEDLADKNSAGTISGEERSEYAALVTALDVIGILQAKARTVLLSSHGA